MSNDKEIISRLFKIVAKQQAAITKLAQTMKPSGVQDLKATVQADIIDLLYGKGTKLIPGKTYAQVQYANVKPSPQGNTLVIGVTVPQNIQQKWTMMKEQVIPSLKTKYSSLLGQAISAIEWRE